MIPAKVEIAFDEKLIRDQIEKRLDEVLTSQLWFVSVKRLAALMDMSERYLEDSILCDPRMKILERRRKWKDKGSHVQCMDGCPGTTVS